MRLTTFVAGLGVLTHRATKIRQSRLPMIFVFIFAITVFAMVLEMGVVGFLIGVGVLLLFLVLLAAPIVFYFRIKKKVRRRRDARARQEKLANVHPRYRR